MKKHVDNFSELIERIQYHLPLEAKWTDLIINQKFFHTFDLKEWLLWKRSYGATLKTMCPVELYVQICFDDKIINLEHPEKEANLTARISNSHDNSGCGGKDKHNQQGGTQGKNNWFQPYDGLHYDGRHPSASYIQKLKEK